MSWQDSTAGYPMMRLSHLQSCRQSVRLLLTLCVSCLLLWDTGTTVQAEEPGETRKQYIELDSEIQAIKQEILEINQEILQIEALSQYPHGQELVVLVSVVNDSPVSLASISLQLDGHAVSQHTYSGPESTALRQGGVHRLYEGRLEDGRHVLDVTVSGKQSGNQPFHQQRRVTITKQPGLKYLELLLGPAAKNSGPELTVNEW
jgi:hypothetical protein